MTARERLEELLVMRVTGEISAEEERDLRHLLGEVHGVDPAGWERAAAELTAALLETPGQEEEMPAGLAAALVSRGRDVVARNTSGSTGVVDIASRRRPNPTAWAGWIVAAAAVVSLLIFPRGSTDSPSGVAASALRDSLIATDGQVLEVAWSATEDESASGASGDVVWSDRDQAGVMRISGLRPNDPTVAQYQLWIFDAGRDDRFPVDGGVFDIPAGGGEVLVPIDARLLVGEATLFAITVERPGGVVVSDRERIVLVAQVAG